MEDAIEAGLRGSLHSAIEALRVGQVQYRKALFRASAEGRGDDCAQMVALQERSRITAEKGAVVHFQL